MPSSTSPRDVRTLEEAGVDAPDIDWFVPHQANRRILEGTAKRLGITEERSSSRSSGTAIPRRLRFRWRSMAAVSDGRIKRGDLVLMEAMGGGFTWGAVLVRW